MLDALCASLAIFARTRSLTHSRARGEIFVLPYDEGLPARLRPTLPRAAPPIDRRETRVLRYVGRMTITITYYDHAAHSSRPERVREYSTWGLALKSLVRAHAFETSDVDDLPCWAPHVLLEGETRLKENVERLDLLVLDLDRTRDKQPIDLSAILGALEGLGVAALVVESRSSTPEVRK